MAVEGGREELLSALRSWCQRELSRLLKSTVESDLLDYLLDIGGEKDLVEYLQDMVGPETMHTKAFTEEFLLRRNQLHAKVKSTPSRTTRDNMDELVRQDRDHMILYSQQGGQDTSLREVGGAILINLFVKLLCFV